MHFDEIRDMLSYNERRKILMKPKQKLSPELLEIIDQATQLGDDWYSPSFGLAFQMRRICRESQRGEDAFMDAVGLLIDRLEKK